MLGTGKLFRWVTIRLNEVDLADGIQGRGQAPTGARAGASPAPTIHGLHRRLRCLVEGAIAVTLALNSRLLGISHLARIVVACEDNNPPLP